MSDRIKKLGRELADQHMKGYAVGRREALADAKARIEGERIESDGMDSWENGYHTGIDAALAALTQPQTEQCPECGNETGPDMCGDIWHEEGGAATAAGVADALTLTPGEARNLVDAAMGDEHDPQLLDSTVKRIGDEADRQLAEPGPYAKAFRERVCPVPEFPGIEKEES